MKALYDYQEVEVQRAMAHKSWFNASEMGLGKTLMTAEWARRKGDIKTIIVVCPLNTFHTWRKEFQSQMPELPVKHLVNTPKHVLSFRELAEGAPGVYLIGWEMMRTGAITGQKADLIVADETHKQANYNGSQQSQLIRHFHSKYKVALSGTPAANKPEGIFATLNWLWPDLYKSYWNWVEKYWRTIRDGRVITLVRELQPGKIIEDIPMFTRLLRSEHRDDMPPVLPEIAIEVDLTPAQWKVYNRLAEESGVWLEDENGNEEAEFISTSVSLVENMRLREVCLAVPSVVDGRVQFKDNAKSSKIDALIEVLNTDELKEQTFLVLTHSAKIVPIVVERLNKKGISAQGFTGTSKADLSTFGSTYRVLVAGIAAIGEGTDGLQEKCHNMFWLSKHPSWLLNEQASKRLDRPGQTEPVNVWYTYVPGTVDEESLETLKERGQALADVIDNGRIV